MQKKEELIKALNALFENRATFYKYFDESIPKIKHTELFDFEKLEDKKLQTIYKLFHHYDYAIRKLLPSLYKAYDIDMDKDLKKDF